MDALTVKRGMTLERDIDAYPDGIILAIDKPYRWTSADVIRKVKYMAIKHFNKKNLKVGHAGTLDPLATGVLLVCIGKATKLAETLQSSPKQYLAGVSFGATTPSYDLEKDIDRTYCTEKVNRTSVEQMLEKFTGTQQQLAPLFSAKSVDGVRAYETARKLYKEGRLEDGQDILHTSTVTIYKLELVTMMESQNRDNCTDTRREDNAHNARINVADISSYVLPTAIIRVDCSKGTYIRALARDFGEALDSGAFLTSLRRTRNGGINVEDALGMDEIMDIFNKK